MPRTCNHRTFNVAFGQRRPLVGTTVFDSIENTVDIKECDFATGHPHGRRAARHNVRNLRNSNKPIKRHDPSLYATRSEDALPPNADEKRFEDFLAEFDPQIAALGRASVARLRARLPSADVMIYDNYNFLVAGFCPNERPSDAVLSIALSARGAALCFLQGAGLPDPAGLLSGSGSVARSIRVASADDFATAGIAALIDAALARARVPFDPSRTGRFYIKSVSAKKRPRRR
jgi:hypothetical protein